jgi:ABC-type proline/glycine betaine transport system permease subunit
MTDKPKPIEIRVPAPEPTPRELERFKLTVDYLKHLTTLSSGSIVLIATFLNKFAPHPTWRALIGVALGGFLLSALTSALTHTLVLMQSFPGAEAETTNREDFITSAVLIAAWVGLPLGLLALGIFVIKNLFS